MKMSDKRFEVEFSGTGNINHMSVGDFIDFRLHKEYKFREKNYFFAKIEEKTGNRLRMVSVVNGYPKHAWRMLFSDFNLVKGKIEPVRFW